MARFIPDIDLGQIPHDSERLVYEALRGLPSDYVVLHSLPWLRPLRDLMSEPLREGEADFVILNPGRGMLVLEVKGGIPKLRSRTWYRGDAPMRDPFEQARRNRYALLDAVEERTRMQLTRKMFPHGDAVVFPHCAYKGELPLNADPRTLIDAGGLHDLPARIELAIEAWTRRELTLEPSQFVALLDALIPKLRLMRCVGTEIESENSRIVQVTEDQRTTLQGLLASDRVLVEGVAGSGKTLLALEFAVSMASAGNSVLFLCYNRHLAAWLNEQAAIEARLRDHRGKLDISTFHAFALSLARKAGVEFDIPAAGEEKFWEQEVPIILEQALDLLRNSSTPPPYDAVVVDEGQDFYQDWWVTVEGLTRSGRKGRLYVFLDLNQSLRGEVNPPPIPLPTNFRLAVNCRNTRAIARTAARIVNVEMTLLPGIPEGDMPAVRRATSVVSLAGIVLEEIRRLLASNISPAQIALIGPAAYENGSLARFSELDGIPLHSNAARWRSGDGILITTSRAFKGLEADVVVLFDLFGFGPIFTKTDLYVAWTRAKHRLIIVCQDAEVRRTVEELLAESSKNVYYDRGV